MSISQEQLSEIDDWTECNRCGNPISWNKEARANLGTNRPIGEDGNVHDCPAYSKGQTGAYSKKQSFQPKKSYETSKPKFKPTPKEQQSFSMDTGNEKLNEILNADDIDDSVRMAIVAMTDRHDKAMAKVEEMFQRQANKTDELASVVKHFVTYNPTDYLFRSLLDAVTDKPIIKKASELQERDRQKTYSTEDHNPTDAEESI